MNNFRGDNMKKFNLILFFVIGVVLISSTTSLAVNGYRETESGGYIYRVNATDVRETIPLLSTQKYHSKGTTTVITNVTSQTRTKYADENLGIKGSIYRDLAIGMGIAQSETYTVTTNVSYTIPSSGTSGYYRITMVFPGSRLHYSKWTTEPSLEDSYLISYAPDKNKAHRILERQQ